MSPVTVVAPPPARATGAEVTVAMSVPSTPVATLATTSELAVMFSLIALTTSSQVSLIASALSTERVTVIVLPATATLIL